MRKAYVMMEGKVNHETGQPEFKRIGFFSDSMNTITRCEDDVYACLFSTEADSFHNAVLEAYKTIGTSFHFSWIFYSGLLSDNDAKQIWRFFHERG